MAAYAAKYPDTVDRLVLYAPSVFSGELPAYLDAPPDAPMRLRTRESAMRQWKTGVACDDQTDDGIYDVLWETVLGYDSLAVAWRPQGDVVRVRTAPISWDPAYTQDIVAPTLIMVGQEDSGVQNSRELYDSLVVEQKVLAVLDCASHYAGWEQTHHRFMHESAANWLSSGQLRGESVGVFRVTADGEMVTE